LAATSTVPIVFASVFDPVGAGLVTSLARPGANITGASIGVGGAGLAGKWVELLKEAVPGISQAAVLANLSNPASATSVREAEAAGRALAVKLLVHDTGTAEALDRALAAIAASAAQGLIVTNDPFFTPNRDKLVQFAAARRLPAIYFFHLFAEAGGLMAYGASLIDSYRKAAVYTARILKGAKPADLPVQQPTHFEMVINLKAARTIGLALPSRLLLRADQVIE
jgi:putative tryptophan/tyrosine transport system substrate-binding protein